MGDGGKSGEVELICSRGEMTSDGLIALAHGDGLSPTGVYQRINHHNVPGVRIGTINSIKHQHIKITWRRAAAANRISCSETENIENPMPRVRGPPSLSGDLSETAPRKGFIYTGARGHATSP
ncbi:hypothetical protein Bbelb_408650 [Branchiostoma belcheri]|nr:hypothetical protein Bbelb_408650 [Branchiostoma belcheri]